MTNDHDDVTIYVELHDGITIFNSYSGDDMYERAIADLEAKLKRQQDTVRGTQEMLKGLKALRDKDQLPLINTEANNATPEGRTWQRT